MNRLFSASVLLSAFLLFQVQPIVGRALLPWFGGTAAVWTTCLVFFQTLLLAGYAYAHLLIRRGVPARVHVALLGLATLALGVTTLVWGTPLLPAASARLNADPIVEAGWLMALSVGLPYFALSSTGPLLQAWFAADPANEGKTPYRLYSLSNLGSLLGLLLYPLVFEPLFGLHTQGWLWAAGFAGFVLAVASVALKQRHVPKAGETAPARPGQLVFWSALAATASLMLLAATQHLGEVIAVLPFLWVLPLALYLFTFVLCFESDRWYRRGVVMPLLGLSLLVGSALLFRVHATHPVVLVVVYCAVVFLTALTCHGELAKSRPPPGQLTSFYLALSFGGALGGAFVSLLAPRLFKTNVEIDLALAAAWVAALAALLRDPAGQRRARAAMGLTLLPLVYVLALDLADFSKRHPKESSRSFFGVVSVRPMPNGIDGHFIEHGGIIHGNQLHDEASRRVATAYYGPSSGVNVAVSTHPRRLAGEPLRIGVVGLGVGVIAAYGRAGDVIRFYEINPDVQRYAQDTRYFTYLSDSPARIEHVLGDARRSMEDELAAGQPGQLDILVLDAFSGHAMPTHLLTSEAFGVYAKMLRDERSLIALLSPAQATVETVLHRVANETGFSVAGIVNADGVKLPEYPSVWILFSRTQETFKRPELQRAQVFVDDGHLPRLWTDDYVNLLAVLKWTIK
ncbi:MAG: ferrichrome ABC transporter permease [Myxococcaceae bacterium]|nr:ferrichrome ABC transporter permease [Myxococcaceae bacterium]